MGILTSVVKFERMILQLRNMRTIMVRSFCLKWSQKGKRISLMLGKYNPGSRDIFNTALYGGGPMFMSPEGRE